MSDNDTQTSSNSPLRNSATKLFTNGIGRQQRQNMSLRPSDSHESKRDTQKLRRIDAMDVSFIGVALCIVIYGWQRRTVLRKQLQRGHVSPFASVEEQWNVNEEECCQDSQRIKFLERKITGATLTTVSALLWPIVFKHLVGFDALQQWPATFIGLLWPIIASLRDLHTLSDAHDESSLNAVFAPLTTRSDATTMVTVTFAMGSLLTSQLTPTLSGRTTPLVMYALALLIGVVVPSPPGFTKNEITGTSESGARLSMETSTTRRFALHWSIGFMLTALMINIQSKARVNKH